MIAQLHWILMPFAPWLSRCEQPSICFKNRKKISIIHLCKIQQDEHAVLIIVRVSLFGFVSLAIVVMQSLQQGCQHGEVFQDLYIGTLELRFFVRLRLRIIALFTADVIVGQRSWVATPAGDFRFGFVASHSCQQHSPSQQGSHATSHQNSCHAKNVSKPEQTKISMNGSRKMFHSAGNDYCVDTVDPDT